MAMVEDTGQWLLRIGEVARITGFPAKTLRYYEELGLVEPGRSEGGYRLYDREDVTRLGFVRQAKLIGLKLGEIKELVELAVGGGRGRPGRGLRLRGRVELLRSFRTVSEGCYRKLTQPWSNGVTATGLYTAAK